MKKLLVTVTILALYQVLDAQELFVQTEPASNMAKGSVGLRLNNYLMKRPIANGVNYQLIPELMLGISKNLMIHGDAFFSNQDSKGLTAKGGSIYAKYRFLSRDDVQKHFRMATYARVSINSGPIYQEEIEVYGQNTGYELGVVATQLLHKVAISGSASYEKALDNGGGHQYPFANRSAAINYTLSAGRLTLPKAYTNFKQTNLNIMIEMLGQTNIGNGASFVDVAPSMQLIFNSTARLDIGYRHQLFSSLTRMSSSGFLVRFEYNFFNLF